MPAEDPTSDADGTRARSAATDTGSHHTSRAPTGGSKLAGSRNNLAASRMGSRMNLAAAGPPPASARTVAEAPVNAVVFENTFKMKPDRKFQSETVRRIAEEILQRNLTKAKYDGGTSPVLAQSISNEILAAVKKLEYERYKIVVDVTIGEFKGQGIRVASRAVWDTTTDSYASASFKNATIFAVAMVFGCYFE